MHSELVIHSAKSIAVTTKIRDGYTVTYITVTDDRDSTHTLKAFHANDKLEGSILEEQANDD